MKNSSRLFLYGTLTSTAVLLYSFITWISEPNHFLYSKEPYGTWVNEKPLQYTNAAYAVKIDASCASSIYKEVEENVPKTPADANLTRDFSRFLQNKNQNLDFRPQEISFPSRFKWFENDYVTYDEPSLRSGIRSSFSIRCLYDRECLLADSINYLLVKVGVRYFLKPAQAEALNSCISNERIYFKTGYHYNFGYSELDSHYGLLFWLKQTLVQCSIVSLIFLISGFLFVHRRPFHKPRID